MLINRSMKTDSPHFRGLQSLFYCAGFSSASFCTSSCERPVNRTICSTGRCPCSMAFAASSKPSFRPSNRPSFRPSCPALLSAFPPAFLPSFFPADGNALQLRIPQMRLIRHIGSPPIFAHFRRFYRFIQPVDQLQLALLHRILFWIVDIRQHFLQCLGNFSPRALCVEKQLIRFVL